MNGKVCLLSKKWVPTSGNSNDRYSILHGDARLNPRSQIFCFFKCDTFQNLYFIVKTNEYVIEQVSGESERDWFDSIETNDAKSNNNECDTEYNIKSINFTANTRISAILFVIPILDIVNRLVIIILGMKRYGQSTLKHGCFQFCINFDEKFS